MVLMEIKEVKEIRLKEVRIDKTKEQRTFTVITEEGQVIVMYLPSDCPFKEIHFG